MKRLLKRLHLGIVGSVNLAVVLLQCFCAYSAVFDPVKHPIWACMNLGFTVVMAVNLLFLVYWLCFHFRMCWLPLAGYLVCAPRIWINSPYHSTPDSVEGTLKVLSYNVMAYDVGELADEGEENSILRYVCESGADIVCLQEGRVGWPLKERRVEQIYREVYPYSCSLTLGGGIDRLVCLSRFPILSHGQIPYESKANGSMACELLIGKDTVLLVNNHFESNKLTKDDKIVYTNMLEDPAREKIEEGSRLLIGKLGSACAIRGPQAVAVSDYIRRSAHRSVILCGDFNDTPLSYTHRVLRNSLQDAFIEAGRGFGVSYNQKGFAFRIDHIMASRDWQVVHCAVDNSIACSDHYPIFCYLKKK